jgi:hypothetical protein
MGSGDYECELESVRIIDDIENKAWRLQAMTANLLSKETAMRPMGVSDPIGEYQKILEEQRKQEDMSRKMQEEAQMAQMGLINEENPQAGSQSGGATPADVNQQADQTARELLQMPETERRRQLTSIRQNNDTLHALVLKKMDQLRTQARSMGMDQALPEVVENVPLQ